MSPFSFLLLCQDSVTLLQAGMQLCSLSLTHLEGPSHRVCHPLSAILCLNLAWPHCWCNFWVLLTPLLCPPLPSLADFCLRPCPVALWAHRGRSCPCFLCAGHSPMCSKPPTTAPGLCRNTNNYQQILSPLSGNACQLCGISCKSLVSLVKQSLKLGKKAQSISNSGIIQHCPTLSAHLSSTCWIH